MKDFQSKDMQSPAPVPSFSSRDDSEDFTLLSIWLVLFRRKYLVLAVLILALLLGIVLALRPAQYTAEGSLQIRPGSANMYRTQVSEALGGGDTDDRIESEVAILQSKTLLTKVAQQLHLQAYTVYAGKYASPLASMDDPRVQDEVITRLRKVLRVQRTPKTEILTIECTSTSPLLASEIVNTLVNSYIEHIFESRFGSTQRAAKFLTGQLDDLKNQVLQDQKELVDLQSKLGVVGFDDTHNIVTSQLEDLARANESASIARITAEARYRILQDERPDLIEGGPAMLSATGSPNTSSLIQSLRANRAQLATEYASISEQFGPNYPETRRLKAQLEEAGKQAAREQERILEQARVAYEAAQRNQTLTNQALTQSENSAFGKRNDMVNYQILLHDYQSNRTLYEGLLQRLREAGVVSGLDSAEVEVIDLATVPVTPVGLGRVSLVIVALAIGFAFALVLALIVNTTDTSVHNVDDLERYIRLPVLTLLPTIDQRSSAKKPAANVPPAHAASYYETLRAPQSPFSEGIRILRSSVLLAKAGQRPHTLLFTSALPSEGKSTVCGNVACVLAQGGGLVLVIDADMRRPSQHTKFRLPNTLGLSSVLTGRLPLEKAVQPSGLLETLHVLTSGPLPPSPADLLSSPAMHELIAKAVVEYDFVLFDAPPSLTISDAAVLAEFVDLVILVVRDGVANKKAIRRSIRLIQHVGATVPGFVYNGVNRRSSEYYEYNKQYGQAQYGFGAEEEKQ